MTVDVENNHAIRMTKVLLRNGGIPNAVNNEGQTPVHYAVSSEGKQAPEKLKLLLEKGGDPTLKDNFNLTPIHRSMLNKVMVTK